MPSNNHDLDHLNGMLDMPGADIVVTRSEEQLSVSSRRVPTSKAVLRRVIVVEQKTVTIDVAHEEVRLEIVPFVGEPDAGARGSHLALPELVLSEEQVVITKRTIPVERVRMVVDSVVEMRAVTEELRRERIDVVGGAGGA